jgi:glycosyltransferase involved in cell wall biosynthesis
MGEHQRRVRQTWPIDGTIWFVPAAFPPTRMPHPFDLICASWGLLGFKDGKPTLRSMGRLQVDRLTTIVHKLRPNLIFAHRLGAVAPLLRARSSLPPVIVDLDDLEHVKLSHQARVTESIAKRLQLRARSRLAFRAERRVVRQVAYTLVCSEKDKALMRASCHRARIAVIPNTYRVLDRINAAPTPTAVFVGLASYAPNRDAAYWLAKEVWPRVRRAIPGARLLVGGVGFENLGLTAHADGIEAPGFLPDLEDFYRQARLAVCPIRWGGGTRIKILEAAAMGRAVVSTTIGAEGLCFLPNVEIAIADNSDDFAVACIALLGDPIRAAALGEAARRRVLKSYSEVRAAAQLTTLCLKALKEVGPVARPEPTSNVQAERYGAKAEFRVTSIGPGSSSRATGSARSSEVQVSIIIGLYNAERFLERCLASVVAQSLKAIEIILIDDGSTDGTLAIAEKFAMQDPRVHILRHGTNRGQSAALNTGFRAANGGTIRFLDGDDVLPPDSSAILYDAYVRHRPDIVRGHARLLENGILKEAKWIVATAEMHGVRFAECRQLWSYLGGVWRHLFDRKFLLDSQLLHDESVLVGQDHIFTSNAYAKARAISILTDCVYYYNVSSNNSLTRPAQLSGRAYADEATALAKTLQTLRPFAQAYLVDLASHVGYRFNLLRNAVQYSTEAVARYVLQRFVEMYSEIEIAAAVDILVMLGYDVPRLSELDGEIAVYLQRGEVDGLYSRLSSYAATC